MYIYRSAHRMKGTCILHVHIGDGDHQWTYYVLIFYFCIFLCCPLGGVLICLKGRLSCFLCGQMCFDSYGSPASPSTTIFQSVLRSICPSFSLSLSLSLSSVKSSFHLPHVHSVSLTISVLHSLFLPLLVFGSTLSQRILKFHSLSLSCIILFLYLPLQLCASPPPSPYVQGHVTVLLACRWVPLARPSPYSFLLAARNM